MLIAIIDILEKIKPGIDYINETDLVTDGILESFEILQLISELSDEFDIHIPLPYIRPENLNSVDHICKMVQTILDEE